MNKLKKLFHPIAIALIIILGISTTVLGITTAKLYAENLKTDVNFDHNYPLVTDEETALKIAEAVGGTYDYNIYDIGDYWWVAINVDVPGDMVWTDGGPDMFIRKVDGAVVEYAEGEGGGHYSERDYRHAFGEFIDYLEKWQIRSNNLDNP